MTRSEQVRARIADLEGKLRVAQKLPVLPGLVIRWTDELAEFRRELVLIEARAA